MKFSLHSRGKTLSLARPAIMGVLNVTPDSFSDGGQYLDVDQAMAHARDMIQAGADIIDIGGESTGPGSPDVDADEEMARVFPVIERLRVEFPDVWLSIDTYKAVVARAALERGVDMVNDVMAMRADPAMVELVAEAGIPVVLMYNKQSTPRLEPENMEYADVMETVIGFFQERVAAAEAAGVSREQIVLDPGMGAFVSSVPKYSMQILRGLERLCAMGFPVLIGASNKSFIGQIMDVGLEDRAEGNAVAHTLALEHGANILRVHDVKAAARVRKMM